MVLLRNSAVPSTQNGALFNCLFLKEHMSLYPAIVNTRVLRYFDLVSFQIITEYHHNNKDNWISFIFCQWSVLNTFIEWCTAVSQHCFEMHPLQNPPLCSRTFVRIVQKRKVPWRVFWPWLRWQFCSLPSLFWCPGRGVLSPRINNKEFLKWETMKSANKTRVCS